MRNFVGSLLTIVLLCGATVGSARSIAPPGQDPRRHRGSGRHARVVRPGRRSARRMPPTPASRPLASCAAASSIHRPRTRSTRRATRRSPPRTFPAWASTLPPAGSSARRHGVLASFGGLTVDPLPEIGCLGLDPGWRRDDRRGATRAAGGQSPAETPARGGGAGKPQRPGFLAGRHRFRLGGKLGQGVGVAGAGDAVAEQEHQSQ